MMKKCIGLHIATRVLCLALLLVSAALPLQAEAKGWEVVRAERIDAKTVIRESDIEIKTTGSTIYVASNHNVQIKIFTILGRLVNADTLPAGTSRLTLPAHGVYIVKVGDLTCKVAV